MPYLLPITMAVWANVHGAFLVGLLLTGIKWMGALGRPRAAAEQYRVSDSATILAALILSGLATLATPWGPRLYPALLHVEAASRSSLVTEWEPTTLQEPTGVLFFAALLGLVVLCQRARTTWNREQLLTFLMFTLLAVREQRAVIWWGMAAAPLFAEALREVYRDRPRRAAAASRDLPGVNLCIAAVFILYLIGCLPWWKGGNPLLPEIKKPLLESATPVRLGEELARLPRAHRIFGNVSWGSYFIWRMRDDQKIFYDPRVHMYPETIMGDYFLITNGFGQWEELLDHHRIDTLVVSPEEQRLLIPLVRKSGKWKEVYKDADRQGMIFLRQRKEENTQ
jgi:hypothetical protein